MVTVSGTLAFASGLDNTSTLAEKNYIFNQTESDFNKISLWRYRHGRVVMFSHLHHYDSALRLSEHLGVVQDDSEKLNHCVYLGVDSEKVDELVDKLDALTGYGSEPILNIHPSIVRNIQASLSSFDQEPLAHIRINSIVQDYSNRWSKYSQPNLLINRVQGYSDLGFSSAFYIMGKACLEARLIELAKLGFEKMSNKKDANYLVAKMELAMLSIATESDTQTILKTLKQCAQLPEANQLMMRMKHVSEGGNGFPEI